MAYPHKLTAPSSCLSSLTESGGSEHTQTITHKRHSFSIFHRAHDGGDEDLRTIIFQRTKAAVHGAATAVLDNMGDVTHEALELAADTLYLAPVVGLAEAAHILLSIWDSVEAVETNRMSCLRLAERCAVILYSVRAEIGAAGQDVADTLCGPMEKLTDSFRRVEHFVQKQVARPFLKRYLKREEDARKIKACDANLTDSMGLFSVVIQIRMLKEIHEQGHHAPSAETPSNPGANEVLAAIATIRAAQAAHNAALDTADLYGAMQAAVGRGSDVTAVHKGVLCQGAGVDASVWWEMYGRALS